MTSPRRAPILAVAVSLLACGSSGSSKDAPDDAAAATGSDGAPASGSTGSGTTADAASVVAPGAPDSGAGDSGATSSSDDAGCGYATGGGGFGTNAGDGGTPADSLVSVSPAATSVELYHPLYVNIVTTQSFSNGYDPDEISLDLDVTGPCGETIVQPCFYEASANNQATWECRFAPRHPGSYSYAVVMNEGGAIASSKTFSFATTTTTTNGFLHADTANAAPPNASSVYNFRFDSGNLWRGAGEDVAWEIDPHTFPDAIPRLSADGENMVRIWHCPWSLGIEWGGAPDQYDAANATYFDQIVTLAEQNGVYIMLMMDDYREYDSNNYWSSNPYNVSNGGSCNSPGDFFSDATAIGNYQKKLRYYIARWGYSPAIQSFEFFNEIDNAMQDESSITAANVASWVATMSSYLHGIDPYNHLVTASVSWQTLSFWAAGGIDFTQSHLYGPNNRITNLLSQQQNYVSTYKKPYSCGEFGLSWVSATASGGGGAEPNAEELHYGMWLGALAPTPILPMTWWWDSFWGWGEDSVFKSAAAFSNDIVARAGAGTLTSLSTSASGGLESGGLVTGNYGYVWVTNYYPGNGTASGVTLTISGLRQGNNSYTVESYDTWNGGFAPAANATSQNGTLTISVGTLNTTSTGSDAAYRVVDVNGPGGD